MPEPLLSIVIANYNYGRFLEDAIKSVIAQDMGDKVELIICDAASTDNSVEVIKKYTNGLPPNTSYFDWIESNPSLATNGQQLTTKVTWWCSEKDGGQSAAFNKGFSHAQGRFLTWLNADDVMLPGTIKKLKLAIDNRPECEWFVGGVLWLDPAMKIIRCGRGRPFSNIRYKSGNVSVWGPSSFFTKRLLDSVGGVDERFFYTMDTDLWLRFACTAGARYMPFSDYAWGLRMHPDAKMSGHNFTAGTYQGGISGSGVKSDRKQLQLDKEKALKREYFTPKKTGQLDRILSISWPGAIGGLLDTWRFRGKHYSEVFR